MYVYNSGWELCEATLSYLVELIDGIEQVEEKEEDQTPDGDLRRRGGGTVIKRLFVM